MKNKKQLATELIATQDLRDLIEAYEEIAAMRMRKVKKSVLLNREFFSGLNEIYRRVMYTFRLSTSRKGGKTTSEWLSLNTNGKTVSVLISSNTGLYGDVIKNTFDLFKSNTTGTATEIAIIGRVGKQLFETEMTKNGHKIPYQYFDMSDNGVDTEKIKAILEYLLSYTNIVVYHGIYVSILSQKPVSTFVTGRALDISHEGKKQELKCIIEPSVEEVTKFFERQILSAIFEQTVYEASLSKFASRMMSLDFAVENITTSIKKTNFARLKLKHASEGLSQIERLSGLQLWMNR